MYDNENTVKASFDLNYVSEYLIQAQWAEFIELKKVAMKLFGSRETFRKLRKLFDSFKKLNILYFSST